ncbi:MAG: YeeE/YedE family protein [Clostridiales bacterium]|jgi:uncharacterized membrane protein YedE/YeeE|nr:YeeE/YedE family protein [Clostridiales bacterium]
MAEVVIIRNRDKTSFSASATLFVITLIGYELYTLHNYAFLPYIFGLAFGYVIQRSRFCFASCFRDIFVIRTASMTRALLLLLALTTVGFAIINFLPGQAGLAVTGKIYPVGIHTALAGIFFGFGMVIAGNCVSGCLVRMGEGYLMQLSTFAGLLFGSLLGAWHLDWWVSVMITPSWTYFLPDLFSWPGALIIQLSLLAVLFKLTAKIDGVSDPLALFRKQQGVPIWSYGTGAVALAVLNILMYWLWGKQWGITGGITHISGWAANKMGIPAMNWWYFNNLSGENVAASFLRYPLIFLSLGMVGGSLFSSLINREFKIRRPRTAKYICAGLAGGFMMGYSSRLAFGCNIGALLNGIGSLSVHGWVFGLFIFIGAIFGGKVLVRYVIS